ncbi:MAG: hypothetical protein ACTH6N_14915 [Brachybacterium tyrofermentans]|uniref:hypothetical protein n=1 Tax=Brachybacterium tyrofermentans TaxID=47848 RepID=UPI00186686CD|nr:hypothetical protein [Brachybacterium tyrofermentans]
MAHTYYVLYRHLRRFLSALRKVVIVRHVQDVHAKTSSAVSWKSRCFRMVGGAALAGALTVAGIGLSSALVTSSQGIQGNPQAIQGNPQFSLLIQGNPQAIQGNPQAIQGNPQAIQGNPQAL